MPQFTRHTLALPSLATHALPVSLHSGLSASHPNPITGPRPYLEVQGFHNPFRRPKSCEAKKQLPEDASCSWRHKIKRDKVQMLTDTVQSPRGLTPRRCACCWERGGPLCRLHLRCLYHDRLQTPTRRRFPSHSVTAKTPQRPFGSRSKSCCRCTGAVFQSELSEGRGCHVLALPCLSPHLLSGGSQ